MVYILTEINEEKISNGEGSSVAQQFYTEKIPESEEILKMGKYVILITFYNFCLVHLCLKCDVLQWYQ